MVSFSFLTDKRYKKNTTLPTVTIKAEAEVFKKRTLMSEDNHLFQKQANDLLKWGFQQALTPEGFDAISDKLVSLQEHADQLGVELPEYERMEDGGAHI